MTEAMNDETPMDVLPNNVVPLPIERGRKVGRLTLYTDIDAEKAAPRQYYLKGLISPGEMSAIYGEPGCGKSFLAVYIGRAIAQSRTVLGKRVHGTNVLFLALEGATGFENRLKAQILQHDHAEGFGYIAQPINLFSDPKAREDVIEAIRIMNAGVFIVDTLNRAMSDGSENDAADMGQFIQNIDAIRAATGAHGMLIHHSGKDSSRGMRGHSALLGAADVVIEVSKDPDSKERTAKVVKAKDDQDGGRYGFYLDIKDLGIDSDGDPITTCVVRETEQEGESVEKYPLTQDEKQWLEHIRELFLRDGKTKMVRPEEGMRQAVACVSRTDLRDWVRARGLVGVADGGPLNSSDRARFNRMVLYLMRKGKLGVMEDWVWLVK